MLQMSAKTTKGIETGVKKYYNGYYREYIHNWTGKIRESGGKHLSEDAMVNRSQLKKVTAPVFH